MTRKRFNNLCRALVQKICEREYGGKKGALNGEILRFYRDREHTIECMKQHYERLKGEKYPYRSYQELWDALEPARNVVGM